MANVIDLRPERARREAALENSSTLRAISVLEALAHAGSALSLADLMALTGQPKPSLHRTLTLFEDAGLVAREPSGRTYVVGPRLGRTAMAVLKHDALAGRRRAILRGLVEQVGEACNLSMLRKGELVYLDRIESSWPLRLYLPPGVKLPAHCSASGKLLLAFRPAAERAALLATLPLTRFTERTITDRQVLAAELDRIAVNRYSVDNEEYVTGVACVAVPVRDAAGDVIAAVAIHAATARLPLSRALEFVPQLNAAALAMCKTLA